MYIFYGKPRTIEDLRLLSTTSNIKRDVIPIAVIDDQEFPYLSLLRDHHFTITKFDDINDIRSLSDYPIVLCDIRGVGRKLHPTLEGAHIISELRKEYPHKVIIAYTAQQYDPSLNHALQHADFVEKKDASLEQWIETLDKAIQIARDPAAAWHRIRIRLMEMGVPIYRIMQLEDQFVGYTQCKLPTFPDKKLSSNLPDNLNPLWDSARTMIKLLPGAK